MNKNILKFIGKIFLVVILSTSVVYADNTALDRSTTAPAGLVGGFMNPTVVSYATEGLWAQATIIDNINVTGKFETKGLGAWVPLLYLLSFVSAIVMLGMGQSPKMAMWFILGPAVYYWMIDTHVEVKGEAWIAGKEYITNMKPVWKLAEVGMTNSAMVNLSNSNVTPSNGAITLAPSALGIPDYSIDNGPGGFTKASWFFVQYDDLLTSTIQELVEWTGIYNQRETKHLKGQGYRSADWYLMTNYKWKMLNDITSSSVKDPNVRDALVSFMSSQCGDAISGKIDSGSYITAKNSQGSEIPATLFKQDYQTILYKENSLASVTVPMPLSVRALVSQPTSTGATNSSKVTSFYDFIQKSQTLKPENQPNLADDYSSNKDISCRSYLWVLMQAFRWEASNAFIHLTQINQEYSIEQKNAVFSLLYGWTFKEKAQQLSLADQKNFVINLILAHMFKNEMTMAKKPVDQAYSSSEELTNSSDNYVKTLGGKSKWSDLFTAFKIFPHIQGLIAYFLIMVFPVAVILMVRPGGWKALVTWMGFYAYIKSWDFGFALAASIERSVWARIGNSDHSEFLNTKILELFKGFITESPTGPGINAANLPITITDPQLFRLNPMTDIAPSAAYRFDEALFHYDRLLGLSNVLDYDLSNSYYVYIMSAVYLAVPTISAQLFLKGKSGMVSSLMDAGKSLGQDGSKAAMQTAQGKLLTDADNSFQTAKQTDYVKAMGGEDSFARKAMQSQKDASKFGLEKQIIGMKQKTLGDIGKAQQMGKGYVQAHFDGMGSLIGTNLQILSGPVDEQMKVAYGRAKAIAGGGEEMLKDKMGFSKKSKKGGTGAGGGGGGGEESGVPQGRGEWAQSALGWVAGDPYQAVKNSYFAGWPEGAKQAMLRGTAGTAGATMMGMEYKRESSQIEAATMLSQSRAGLESYEYGAKEDSAKVMASRFRAAAEQQANESVWSSQRNLGNQYSSYFSALGATPGRYSAGPKATNMEGMAGMGMLGDNTYMDGNGSALRNEDGTLMSNPGGFQTLFSSLDYNTAGSTFKTRVDEGSRNLDYLINGVSGDPAKMAGMTSEQRAAHQKSREFLEIEANNNGWGLTNALSGDAINSSLSTAWIGSINSEGNNVADVAAGNRSNFFQAKTDTAGNATGYYESGKVGSDMDLASQFGHTKARAAMTGEDGQPISIARYSNEIIAESVSPFMTSTGVAETIVETGVKSSQLRGEDAQSVVRSQAELQKDIAAGIPQTIFSAQSRDHQAEAQAKNQHLQPPSSQPQSGPTPSIPQSPAPSSVPQPQPGYTPSQPVTPDDEE